MTRADAIGFVLSGLLPRLIEARDISRAERIALIDSLRDVVDQIERQVFDEAMAEHER